MNASERKLAVAPIIVNCAIRLQINGSICRSTGGYRRYAPHYAGDLRMSDDPPAHLREFA
jgi:hypothetical protein